MSLEFESGIIVEGKVITGTRDLQGKILLVTFKDCTVTYFDQVLFKPEWGVYDMAIGKEVVSAFAGPADVNSFEEIGKVSETKTHKIVYSDSDEKLFELYSQVRVLREAGSYSTNDIKIIFDRLTSQYPDDWLLPLELFEMAHSSSFDYQGEILAYLEQLMTNKSFKKLINNGLKLIKKNELQDI